MTWPEKAEQLYGKMKNNTEVSTELLLDGMVYYVARHYKVSISEVLAMSPETFEQSFVWATASDRLQSDEMEKATNQSKTKTSIGSTERGTPFPGSDGW
jgi:hypothetical protein